MNINYFTIHQYLFPLIYYLDRILELNHLQLMRDLAILFYIFYNKYFYYIINYFQIRNIIFKNINIHKTVSYLLNALWHSPIFT